VTPKERLAGFRRNCLDSIGHALGHFSANHHEDYGFHNQKWAVLSVAHAAEAFCNLLFIALDSDHPHGKKYPSLADAIKRLQGNTMPELSTLEIYAIHNILPGLESERDVLMHRPAPLAVDVQKAALTLLALVHLVRRRLGVASVELLEEDPPIESVLLDELRLEHQDAWFTMAEILAMEDYGEEHLQHCENCGRFTRSPMGCLACFVDT
jgi:hypothetical protein